MTLINNIIAGNTSTDAGTVNGGGISMVSSLPINLINNTIVDNRSNNASGLGGGLWIGMQSPAAVTNIYNNIFFGNSVLTSGNGQDLFIDNSSAGNAAINFFNNDFNEACFDNSGAPTCDPAAIASLSQGGNITAPGLDPLFIDAAAGNFQLGLGSPAIDAGTSSAPNLPATDHDGNPRVVGGEVDMGALEAQPDIDVDPIEFSYGDVGVGEEAAQILTISNVGSVPINVTDLALSDETNYSLDPAAGANPCGSLNFTLDGGESCTIGVVFNPSDDGLLDATLTISSDDPDEPEIVVSLTGVGQSANLS
ncbi:MAG TPA: choice-of-anchor D domain-containing protein, partial [bacterium]|nr:choice-of-anchor D domain-containing protein [bacterium]